jgi:hypothetical protein
VVAGCRVPFLRPRTQSVSNVCLPLSHRKSKAVFPTYSEIFRDVLKENLPAIIPRCTSALRSSYGP